jgi:hypothetical protein
MVGTLLEGLETKINLVNSAELDAILAGQKEALGHSGLVLNCASCIARPEYMLFLGLISEKVATLCELIVTKYTTEIQRHSEHERSFFSDNGALLKKTFNGRKTVFLGDYKIESPVEWDCLIRVLIALQLRSFGTFLTEMRRIAALGPNPTQVFKVQATERRIGNLIQKLRQPEFRTSTCVL